MMTWQIFLGLVVAVSLAVLALIARWGWQYGSKPHATWPGLAARLAILLCIASWSIAVSVGHGVGIAPVPALLCVFIAHHATSCVPPWWVTPSITAIAFLAPAFFSARRERLLHRS